MSGILWCAVVALVVGSQGLELSLNLNSLDMSGDPVMCGVLLCVESYSTPNTTLTLTDSDTSDSLKGQESATISSLKVFRVATDKTRTLLASVTSKRSRLFDVSDGINTDGRLEAGWATLRLELAKQTDCQADYVCESQAVSAQGNKLFKRSHILQQARQSMDKNSNLNGTPKAAFQVLALIQQLDTKFGYLSSSVEKLEQGAESIKADLNTKSDRLEDRILSQSDRLEDKIESFKNRIEDNLKEFQRSMTDDISGKLLSCVIDKDDKFETQVQTELSLLGDKLSTVGTDLLQLQATIETNIIDNFKRFGRKIETWKDNDELLFKNLTLGVQNITFINTDMLSGVTEGLISLENSVDEKLEDLSSNMNASALETKTLISQSVLQGNSILSKELTSALTDMLTPKNCYKGMVSVLASTPYAVVRPDQENLLGFPILCDTFTDGGGWIVFQRRITGDVNFYRGWEDYKNGFGSIYGDFWLGNEKIHTLTSNGTFELRIDLKYQGKSAFAHYDTFSVGDEANNYILHVGNYDGTAGDSLITAHNGRPFSTYDRDNDNWPENCAARFVGAWWYGACHHSNLNGKWKEGGNKGPRWNTLSQDKAVSYTEIKIRREHSG